MKAMCAVIFSLLSIIGVDASAQEQAKLEVSLTSDKIVAGEPICFTIRITGWKETSEPRVELKMGDTKHALLNVFFRKDKRGTADVKVFKRAENAGATTYAMMGVVFVDDKFELINDTPGKYEFSVTELVQNLKQAYTVQVMQPDGDDELKAHELFTSKEGIREFLGATPIDDSVYDRLVLKYPKTRYAKYANIIRAKAMFDRLKHNVYSKEDGVEKAKELVEARNKKWADMAPRFTDIEGLKMSLIHEEALYYQALCIVYKKDYERAVKILSTLTAEYEQYSMGYVQLAKSLMAEIRTVMGANK